MLSIKLSIMIIILGIMLIMHSIMLIMYSLIISMLSIMLSIVLIMLSIMHSKKLKLVLHRVVERACRQKRRPPETQKGQTVSSSVGGRAKNSRLSHF